jgi:twitching motility protein PilT
LFSKFQQQKNLDFAPVIDADSHRIVDDEGDCTRDSEPSRLQRFRANYFVADNQMGGCFRIIPCRIPDLQWARFPLDLADTVTSFRNGLVLFTGVTGSGKSTSLAMMIKRLIAGGARRIITIEDPIEYVFDQADGSLISQRSVGRDVDSFSDGLKYGLRQDPDVMLVGEIRDQQTAQIALSAAETGHLIFATMHTRDAKGAISRIADLFPQSNQFEIRSQLAFGLRAVVSQHLLPSYIAGEKRELALEVLYNTLPIAAAIRTGKIESIDNNIQTGRSDGMYLLDDSIRELLIDGRITRETALKFVSDQRNLM